MYGLRGSTSIPDLQYSHVTLLDPNTNITSVVGDSAYLPCVVKNLAEYTVSFPRLMTRIERSAVVSSVHYYYITHYASRSSRLYLPLIKVSWLRGRDTSVLSVGHAAFSSDKRFNVIQVPKPKLSASDWTLEVTI